MLTMIHSNSARVEGGLFRVDRKFHVGMLQYASAVDVPLVTVHPESVAGRDAIDTIEVPCNELPYRVLTIKVDANRRPVEDQKHLLEQQIAQSDLVYGSGMGSSAMARFHRVPYILIHEYDLQTQIVVASTQVSSVLRQVIRALKVTWKYATETLPDARRAQSIHCNGYPIHDELCWVNDERLLYLDSRMSADMVISRDALTQRLSSRRGRRLRLLYSGRYERLKGAVDAVKVAIAATSRGLDVEMHCYGAGGEGSAMKRLVQQASMDGRIWIHDPVTYPELVELSRGFDVFVCCHVQGDPSCTYLESFGAGLPIVGYGNRMWRRLSEHSGAGRWSPLKRPERVVDELQRVISDDALLESMSWKAREFALTHSFEREYELRTAALNKALRATAPGTAKRHV